jgi:hypothetical protein
VALVVAGSFFLFVVALLSNIFGVLFSPFWPTNPEIHPPPGVVDPSLNPFFSVKNTSAFFDITDAAFTCGADMIYFEDSRHNTLLLRDTAVLMGPYSVRSGGGMIEYECNAARLVEIRPDGSISMREGMSSPANNIFLPPINFLRLCLWIEVNHATLRSPLKTVIYQWPKSASVREWSEGPVFRDQPSLPDWPPSAAWALRGLYNEGLPRTLRKDALECSPSVRLPYALFTGDPRPRLIVK